MREDFKEEEGGGGGEGEGLHMLAH